MKLKSKKGQVVFEYILVTLVLVGTVMAAYTKVKSSMRKPLTDIKKTLEGDGTPQGKDAGTGQKVPSQYYRNVKFGVK